MPPCSDDMPGLTVWSCLVHPKIKSAIPYPRAAVPMDRPRSGAAAAPVVRHLFSTRHHPVLQASSTPTTTRRTGWFYFSSSSPSDSSTSPSSSSTDGQSSRPICNHIPGRTSGTDFQQMHQGHDSPGVQTIPQALMLQFFSQPSAGPGPLCWWLFTRCLYHLRCNNST